MFRLYHNFSKKNDLAIKTFSRFHSPSLLFFKPEQVHETQQPESAKDQKEQGGMARFGDLRIERSADGAPEKRADHAVKKGVAHIDRFAALGRDHADSENNK
jgi:hypothetical protein